MHGADQPRRRHPHARTAKGITDVGSRLEPADDVEFESAIPYHASWGPLNGFVTVVRPAPLADQVTTPTCDGDLASHEVYCYDLADGVYTLNVAGESVLLRAVEGELYGRPGASTPAT